MIQTFMKKTSLKKKISLWTNLTFKIFIIPLQTN